MRRGLRSSTLGDNAPTATEPPTASTQESVITSTTMPETQPGVVYLQNRREVRKFFGDGEARLAEEFKDEIQRVWAAQPGLSEEAKLDILLCNVGPTVRAELRCQPVDVQKSADKSLSAIVRVLKLEKLDLSQSCWWPSIVVVSGQANQYASFRIECKTRMILSYVVNLRLKKNRQMTPCSETSSSLGYRILSLSGFLRIVSIRTAPGSSSIFARRPSAGLTVLVRLVLPMCLSLHKPVKGWTDWNR